MAIGRIPEPGTGIQESIIAAKGDLISGTANDAPAILTVGANGTTLVADSSEATGLKWQAPASGGKVLQVVQGTITSNFTTSSTSLVDVTGFTIAITPSLATSKIMILVSAQINMERAGSSTQLYADAVLLRDSTQIQRKTAGFVNYASATGAEIFVPTNFSILDEPNTTSAITYKIQTKALSSSSSIIFAASAAGIGSIVAMEIGA